MAVCLESNDFKYVEVYLLCLVSVAALGTHLAIIMTYEWQSVMILIYGDAQFDLDFLGL